MPETRFQTLPSRPAHGFFARLLTAVIVAASRRRDRLRLGKLDAHLLRDIGLDPNDAHRECDKPFWRS